MEAPDLAGKVVFVGQSELINANQDGFITVFQGPKNARMGGVEIAATALADLLDGRLLEPAGLGLTLAWIGGFGVVIGLIAGLLPALLAVPLGLAFAGAGYLGAQNSVRARRPVAAGDDPGPGPAAARPVRRAAAAISRRAAGAGQHQPGPALLSAGQDRSRAGRRPGRPERAQGAAVRSLHGVRRAALHELGRRYGTGPAERVPGPLFRDPVPGGRASWRAGHGRARGRHDLCLDGSRADRRMPAARLPGGARDRA